MDNYKKLLEAISKRIDSNELTNAVKEDKWDGEFEFSDDALESAVNQVNKLLTVESATANQQVIEAITSDLKPKHKKSFLSKVEEDLKPIYDKLGIDYASAEYLSDLVGKIPEALDDKIAGSSNDDTINSLKEDKQALLDQIEQLKQDHVKELTGLTETHTTERMRDAFNLKANTYKWADAYSDEDLRGAILDKVWDKINAKATLRLVDGEIKPFQKDLPDKELYIEGSNNIATLPNLLESEIDKYLKKSDPAPDPAPKPAPQAQDIDPRQAAILAKRQEVFDSQTAL